MLKNKPYFLFLAVGLLIVLFLIIPVKTKADTPSIIQLGNFGGYAWSPNIGWIDMSGVSFDATTINATNLKANLDGYAWSPNIGWISFNETAGCPSGPGTGSVCKPYVNFESSNGAIFGWARAWSLKTSAIENYDQESNTTTGDPEEWADGWISFRGTGYGTGCAIITGGSSGGPIIGSCSGYAWGSKVIGWIDFSPVLAGYAPNSNTDVTLKVNDSIGPITVFPGNPVTLTWTGTNLNVSPPNWCNLSVSKDSYQNFTTLPPGGCGLSFCFPSTNGSSYVVPSQFLTGGTYTYQIRCFGPNVWPYTIPSSAVDDVIVNIVIPALSMDSPSCNTLQFVSATNISPGTACSGTAANYFNQVPNYLPKIVNNVSAGTYNLSCDGVTSNSVSVIDCENPPSPNNGDHSVPVYHEN